MISGEDILKKARVLISTSQQSNINIISRNQHYKPDDKSHNENQPLESIQFEFSSIEERDKFEKFLRVAEKDIRYKGCAEVSKKPILQVAPSYFSSLDCLRLCEDEDKKSIPPTEKLERYEKIPTGEEANFLLFSIKEAKNIPHFLEKFPTLDHRNRRQKGCSVTLTWSGNSGFNIPVESYENGKIGFVLDPTLVDLPQADLRAWKSGGEIKGEFLKEGATRNNGYVDSTLISKYPKKAGYLRIMNQSEEFCTNLARNEHLPGPEKKAIYHPRGSAKIFAGNIWRKFHKRGCYSLTSKQVMKLNEGIALQKGEKNPIAGLFIIEAPTQTVANELLNILKKYPSLKLYFYNRSSTEHIVRYLNNGEAQAYLENPSNFKDTFLKATPFKGFGPSLESKVEEKDSLEITHKKIVAFKKIYKALRNSQTGLECVKSNFFARAEIDKKDNKTVLEIITDYSKTHLSSRTAMAWKLAQEHYNNCTSENTELFKAVYQWSFSQRFFSRSQLFGTWCGTLFSKNSVKTRVENENNFAETITNHATTNPGSRTGTICSSLK